MGLNAGSITRRYGKNHIFMASVAAYSAGWAMGMTISLVGCARHTILSIRQKRVGVRCTPYTTWLAILVASRFYSA